MSSATDYEASFKLTGRKRASDEEIARGLGVTVEFYRERINFLTHQIRELKEREKLNGRKPKTKGSCLNMPTLQ